MIETNALFLKMQNTNAPGLRNTTTPGPAGIGTWNFLDADGIACRLEEELHQYVVAEAGLTQNHWINLPWPGQWGRIAVNSVKQNLLDEFGLAIIPTNMPVKMLVVNVTNEIHISLPAETGISEIQNFFKISDPWKDLSSVVSNYNRIARSNGEKSRQAFVHRKSLSHEELTDQFHETEDVYNDYFSRIRTGVTIRPTQFLGPNAAISVTHGENQLIGIDTSFLQLVCIAYGIDSRNYSTVRIVLPPDSPKGNFDYCVNVAYLGRQSLCEQIRKQFGLTGRMEMIKTNALVLEVKNPNAPSLQAPDKFPKTYTTVSHPVGHP